MLLLLPLPASALDRSVDETFDGATAFVGGTVAGGVLSVTDGSAVLDLAGATAMTLSARLRLVDGEQVLLGGLALDYTLDGGVVLADSVLPFPDGHYAWEPDDTWVIEPSEEYWDSGNTLHCEVFFDDATNTWFLFWTGERGDAGYPYRSIGVATSDDGQNWTRYEGNPVLWVTMDTTTVDGIHVHMPTVVKEPAGTWHMYYSCYQNGVGHRVCHATSDDGFDWATQGVVVDQGAAGEFDEVSLRMPDVVITDDGTWHMLYNGTKGDEHYGPTGYATSTDGWTWTKHGAITADEWDLQGGGMYIGPYGVEQWWNCADVFCHSTANPTDLSAWTEDPSGVLFEKGWDWWNDGYVQSPSPWLVGGTWHMWFNAYTYDDDAHERIGHAQTVPVPGEWMDVALAWDGATLAATVNGATMTTAISSFESLEFSALGTAELDEVHVAWTVADEADTGTPSAGDSGGASGDSGEAPAGCGCHSSQARVTTMGVLAWVFGSWRRRSPLAAPRR